MALTIASAKLLAQSHQNQRNSEKCKKLREIEKERKIERNREKKTFFKHIISSSRIENALTLQARRQGGIDRVKPYLRPQYPHQTFHYNNAGINYFILCGLSTYQLKGPGHKPVNS